MRVLLIEDDCTTSRGIELSLRRGDVRGDCGPAKTASICPHFDYDAISWTALPDISGFGFAQLAHGANRYPGDRAVGTAAVENKVKRLTPELTTIL